MKTLKLIALAAFALLFSQCKTTAPTAPSGPAPSLLEVQQILDTTASKFLQYADSTNGDPWKAIMLTADWVKSQPTVQSVVTLDSIYINIVLKSGLQTTFYFNQVDDSGKSIFRGGAPRTQSEPISLIGTQSKNVITNKKVLLYAPGYTNFFLSSIYPALLNRISNSGLGLEVTVLKDEECTPAIVKTFKDYGLVILDTHGMPDAFVSGTEINVSVYYTKDRDIESQYNDAVIKQYGQDFYDRLISNDYRSASYFTISVHTPNWQKRDLHPRGNIQITTQYIKTLPPIPNTIIFGNMCYSGYGVPDPAKKITYPIKTAFMDKNPISYYGFAFDDGTSMPVDDNFSKLMEDSLVKRLIERTDSTGRGSLTPDGKESWNQTLINAGLTKNKLYFRHFGADDYSYEKCGDFLIDERDGQKYPTVCIGKQVWMAKNLNYNAQGSRCYENNSGNCETYGRLYDLNTMTGGRTSTSTPSGIQGICPKGWHVPSSNEFAVLAQSLGSNFGGAMKSVSSLWESPNIGATNSSGFSALPGGNAFDTAWSNLGQVAWFGTTRSTFSSPNQVWRIFGLRANSSEAVENDALEEPPLNWYTSCRCVKDP